MHYLNFNLRYPQGVEVVGLGHNWDLHNFADLAAYRYDPALRVCEFEWSVAPQHLNPWGDPSNTHAGCRIRLTGVRRCVIEGAPPSPGAVLAEIGSVSPEGKDEPFDLWFLFEGGPLVKVAAKTAELKPLRSAA